MGWGHRILGLSTGLALLGALAVSPALRAADAGEKTVLGGLLSKALSTPASRVAIGGVDGALSSDAVIRDVSVSDRDGVWLRLDRARIVWRRLALLSGRLEVDRLEVGRLEVLRRPLPAADAPVEEPDGTLLPDLPVKVEIKAFALAELALGEGIAGQPARLSAAGRARLGAPSEGLDLDVGVRRLDAGGEFQARLLFVPKGERLEARLTLKEPDGGLLSKGLSLPGTPAIDLDLDGRGTLDAFGARLDFAAGEAIGARGTARLSRIGAERRLGLDLAARVEGLLPGPAAAVFAGQTRLEGALGFADSGAVSVDRLELTSRTARLDLRGRLDAARQADFTVQARALPGEAGPTRANEAEIASLVLDGSLKGPLDRPRLRAALRAAGLRAAGGAVERVEADVSAEPGDAGRFALAADARVEGLSLPDVGVQRALGTRASLAFRGTLGADGILDVQGLHVEAPTLTADYAGRIGRNTLDGRVTTRVADLAAFSGLAGRGLAGSLSGTAALSGDPARRSIAADLDLGAAGLSLGSDPADRLIGDAPRLRGRVFQVYDGYGFTGLRLDGAGVVARLDGQATRRKADAALDVDLRSLAALHAGLTGRAGISGRLSGSLDRLGLFALVAAPEATALGRPVRGLRVEADIADLLDRPDGALKLGGEVGGKALTGGARLARRGPDWTLDGLDLALGSARLDGRAAVDAASALAEGEVRLRAADLDDLSALALTPLAGRIDAAITLGRAEGRQDAGLRGQGAGLRAGGFALGRLDADLTGRDLRARPRLDGRLEADRIVAAGQTFDTLRLSAVGGPAASEVGLAARARGFDLDAAARVVPGPATRVEIGRLSATRGRDRLALARPAAITLADGGAVIDGLTVAAGSGRVGLDGRVGRDLDLTVSIRALPLALARIAVPGLDLAGTLDGEAQVRGSPERPEGRYALTLARFATPETRRAGLPPIEARAAGTLADGRIGLDGRVSAGRGADLTLSGSLPAEARGNLALAAKGGLDAALANTLLAAGGQRLSGRVAVDARVGGTLAAPRAEGSATLTGGGFTDPLQGIRLTGVEARATGRGDEIVLERLTATTRNGGRLGASGRVALAPAAGFPGAIRLTATNAELVSSPLITAVASLDLSLDGPLARRPRIAGRVDVASIDVAVPDRLPVTVRPLPGIRRVNTPPDLARRLETRAARHADARRAAKATPPFDASLDVRISAPNRVFVRGRGIDAELGGELRVTGSSRDPSAVGGFEMRRGRLAILGQRLDFTRGRVGFAGAIAVPDLDFVAEAKAAEITARVAVSGPADQPVFALTSEPALPQDEVLSRLLFQKAAGSLSPFQALQLAQAVSQLSGGAGGPDVFEAARKGLGLDSLDVSTGTSGGPAVGASRYLGERLSVGVKAGAKPADTGATIGYDVTRRVKIQGEAGSDGRTSVGVGAEWEY